MAEQNPQDRSALASFYGATKRADLAEKEYKLIIDKHPDDITSRRALALLYFLNNRVADAEKVVDVILKSHPEDGRTLLLRGLLRTRQGHAEEAVGDLQGATRAEPRWPVAHYYLAVAEVQRGELKVAEAELQNALELQPDFTDARALLASMRRTAETCSGHWPISTKLWPASHGVQLPMSCRSILLAAQGNGVNAEKSLLPAFFSTSIHSRPPGRPPIALWRGSSSTSRSTNKHEHFLINPTAPNLEAPETLLLLGLTYLAEKRPDVGLKEVQSRLASYPDWAEGHEVIGELLVSAGRGAEAEAPLQKAISLNQNLARAYVALGTAQASQ